MIVVGILVSYSLHRIDPSPWSPGSSPAPRPRFVYVIGLHAVQFGNNWMRKIPRTAKLDEAVGRVQFGSPRNFLNPIISKFDKHVVLLPINYRASENLYN